MTWRKRDCDYETHAQILEAGPDAAHVFDVLLGINERWRCGGVLLGAHASISTIHGRLGVHRTPPGRIRKALEACARVGLIELVDGGIRIASWGSRWATVRPGDQVETSGLTGRCSRCGSRCAEGARRCDTCVRADAQRRSSAGKAQVAQPALSQVGAAALARASDLEKEKEGESMHALSGSLMGTETRARADKGRDACVPPSSAESPDRRPDFDGIDRILEEPEVQS